MGGLGAKVARRTGELKMSLNRDTFSEVDLIKVPRPTRPVVLVSGGPIMELESEENGKGLCSWRDDDGKLGRAVFPLACLYECRDMGEYQR